ncbi:MAG: NADH-quinone oxidoreductase subunit N [Candidatus Goldbacteria bacterium]|nr:NADH-quinone oxidoreductase subunit N [Candidatus Goldiibacteriota bacterium]
MNWFLLSDEMMLGIALILILLIDFVSKNKRIIGYFFNVVILVLFIFVILNKREGQAFYGAFVYDGVSWFAKIIFLSGALLTGLLSVSTIKLKEKYYGAYYMILGASTLGMMFMASSKELITLYLGLELTTISLYALSAIYKNDSNSLEAGIKYLLLGAISSGLLLYGISLVYGITRTTYLDEIIFYISQNEINPAFVMGVIFIILGASFKLSAVPLHVWTPDVYQGSPTAITGFISVASKSAGFVFVLRLLSYMFLNLNYVWVPILSVIAFLTMTIGNLIAIPQKNIKRLLAYSTISQAGYMLVGLVGASVIGISSVLFYLFIYTFTNIAAFAVVAGVEKYTGSCEISEYTSLSQRNPLLALTFLLSLLSLAGIPPLAGFVGKFYLFYAAMQRGYLWLVILAALNSTLSLYYYLMVLKQMYIRNEKAEMEKIKLPFNVVLVLVICIAAIIIFGIMPTDIIDLTIDAGQAMFAK